MKGASRFRGVHRHASLYGQGAQGWLHDSVSYTLSPDDTFHFCFLPARLKVIDPPSSDFLGLFCFFTALRHGLELLDSAILLSQLPQWPGYRLPMPGFYNLRLNSHAT